MAGSLKEHVVAQLAMAGFYLSDCDTQDNKPVTIGMPNTPFEEMSIVVGFDKDRPYVKAATGIWNRKRHRQFFNQNLSQWVDQYKAEQE